MYLPVLCLARRVGDRWVPAVWWSLPSPAGLTSGTGRQAPSEPQPAPTTLRKMAPVGPPPLRPICPPKQQAGHLPMDRPTPMLATEPNKCTCVTRVSQFVQKWHRNEVTQHSKTHQHIAVCLLLGLESPGPHRSAPLVSAAPEPGFYHPVSSPSLPGSCHGTGPPTGGAADGWMPLRPGQPCQLTSLF